MKTPIIKDSNKYLQHGICIWCHKSKPEVTFNNRPHTITKKLGATKIGFDICDECNKFFGDGTNEGKYPMSVEVAFKEVMNIRRFLLLDNRDENSYKNFKSKYFNYYHSKSKIKFSPHFRSRPFFLNGFARQFKKGVYEIFLQEYHRKTQKGLDKKFDRIRSFVRDDIGDIPLYFMENNGVYFIEESIGSPELLFNEKVLSEIDGYGFYTLYFFGSIFFLEVAPKSEISREIYLRNCEKEYVGSGFCFSALREFRYISDFDFSLRKIHEK